MFMCLVLRLIVVMGLVTTVSESAAFPITYARLFRPSDGTCVDVIGDWHAFNHNNNEADEAFLDALEKLDKATTGPINLLWEGTEESLRLGKIMAQRYSDGRHSSLLLPDGFRRLRKMLHHTTFTNIDRPEEVGLATMLINEAIKLHRQCAKNPGSVVLSDQVLAFEQSLYSSKSILTVEKFIRAYDDTDRTVLNSNDGLSEQMVNALGKYNQCVQETWQQLHHTYLKGHEELTFAAYLQKLATEQKLEKLFKYIGGDLATQLGDAVFLRQTCKSLAQCKHTIVVSGAWHIEHIRELLRQDLGFVACDEKFSPRGNEPAMIPDAYLLIYILSMTEKCPWALGKLPALDQSTWERLSEDPEQSYETSNDFDCFVHRWTSQNRKAREENDKMLAENDKMLAENAKEMEKTYALIKHVNETLAISGADTAMLRGQGSLNNSHS